MRMNRFLILLPVLFFLFFVFIFAACGHFSPTQILNLNTKIAVQPTPTQNMTVFLDTPTPAGTSTPEPLTAEELLKNQPTIKSQPTMEAILPQSITFPTPLPTNAVDWRPPLYEIPWAPGPHDHFYFLRPIAVNEVNWPLPDYRYGGTFFAPDIVHTGIDIVAPRGTPVLAAEAGRVVWAGTGLYFGVYNPEDPYGMAVVIEHEFGYKNNPLFTVYAHMDEIKINLGESVKAHQQIGILGNTGFTTGPHLHFEVRVGDNNFFQTRNPELWIAPPQGWGIAAARIMNLAYGPIEKLDVKLTSLSTKKVYQARTYTMRGINSDDYYQENFALSDLSAGYYQVSFDYQEQNYVHTIEIKPGVVTYFSFHPDTGFSDDLPIDKEESSFTPDFDTN